MTDQFTAIAAPRWHGAMPGAVAGILMMANLAVDPHRRLDDARDALVRSLRERYGDMSRAEFRATPPLPAYDAYYSRFKQTYHVLLQCESIAIKGKPLPRRPPLVEAMFLAELDSLLLTAGHDLDQLMQPVLIDVAGENEGYTGISGKAETCRPGDMLMRDGQGVVCSIIQGPDDRTRMTAETRNAVFVVYAPPGIGTELVRQHLHAIVANVQIVAPDAETTALFTIEASPPQS